MIEDVGRFLGIEELGSLSEVGFGDELFRRHFFDGWIGNPPSGIRKCYSKSFDNGVEVSIRSVFVVLILSKVTYSAELCWFSVHLLIFPDFSACSKMPSAMSAVMPWPFGGCSQTLTPP